MGADPFVEPEPEEMHPRDILDLYRSSRPQSAPLEPELLGDTPYVLVRVVPLSGPGAATAGLEVTYGGGADLSGALDALELAGHCLRSGECGVLADGRMVTRIGSEGTGDVV